MQDAESDATSLARVAGIPWGPAAASEQNGMKSNWQIDQLPKKKGRKRLNNDKQITIYNKAGFVLGKHLQWFPEVHPHVWAQCSRMSKAFRSHKEITLIFVGNGSYFCRVMSIRYSMGEVVCMQKKPYPKPTNKGCCRDERPST